MKQQQTNIAVKVFIENTDILLSMLFKLISISLKNKCGTEKDL